MLTEVQQGCLRNYMLRSQTIRLARCGEDGVNRPVQLRGSSG